MIKQLSEKLGALVGEMRAHVDANPNMNAEAEAKFSAIEAEISKIEKQIEREKAVQAREKSLETSPILPNVGSSAVSADAQAEFKLKQDKAFGQFLRYGHNGLDAEQRQIMNQRLVREDGSGVTNPQMALTVTTTGGGYLVPSGFSDQLEIAEKFYGGIATIADTIATESGNPLPWPTVNDTAQKATLLGINTQATENDMAFGNQIFNAYKFTSGVIQVPFELLQDSYFDVNAYIANAFGERFGRAKNYYGTVGTGSSQPNGIVTALAAASQNVVLATGNTTTLTGDNLIDLEHAVDIAYRGKAKYMLADGSLKLLRKLKDSYGRYLWIPGSDGGFSGGNPATLNGYQYVVNNDMAVPAANAYTVTFGDMSKFKVRAVTGYTMLRLTERYADFGQVGFIAFARWDSNLIDAGTHPVAAIQQSAT